MLHIRLRLSAALLAACMVAGGLTPAFASETNADEQETITITDSVPAVADGENTSTEASGNIVAQGTCGENASWTLDEEGTLTIRGSGIADTGVRRNSSTDKITPPWPVTVEHAVVESGITELSEYFFAGTTGLKTIELPDTLVILGKSVFLHTGLTSICIPDSVDSIGANAFRNCKQLTSVALPTDMPELGSYLFTDCSNLTSVTLPENLTVINVHMFENCTSLEEISIPTTVKKIYSYAFYNCSALKSISLSSSITYIGREAFESCTSLCSIVLPVKVKTLYTGTFGNCTSLSSVSLPDNLSTIENCTFQNCSSLTDLTIPSSVETIQSYAFYGCTGLKTVDIQTSGLVASNAFGQTNVETGNWEPLDAAFTVLSHSDAYEWTTRYAVNFSTIGDSTWTLPGFTCKSSTNRIILSGPFAYSRLQYVFYRRESGGTWKKIKTSISETDTSVRTSFRRIDRSVTNGSKYEYRVDLMDGDTVLTSTTHTTYYLDGVQLGTATGKTGSRVTLHWERNSKATGYLIQYSTNKNFSNKKNVWVTNNTTTKKTISGLKSRQKYYFRVRAYKKVSGKYYYSSWSHTDTPSSYFYV